MFTAEERERERDKFTMISCTAADMSFSSFKDLDVWRHGQGAGAQRYGSTSSQNLFRPALKELSIPAGGYAFFHHHLNALKSMSIGKKTFYEVMEST